jgi:hypothetical protein
MASNQKDRDMAEGWRIFESFKVKPLNKPKVKYPVCPHCTSRNITFDGPMKVCLDCNALIERFMFGPRYDKDLNDAIVLDAYNLTSECIHNN